jgi:hypothetical protein
LGNENQRIIKGHPSSTDLSCMQAGTEYLFQTESQSLEQFRRCMGDHSAR